MRGSMLAAGLVLAAVAATAAAEPVSASERKKLEKAFAEYVREPDAKARGKIWKSVSAVAKKLSIEEKTAPAQTWTPAAGYSEIEFNLLSVPPE